MNKAAKSGTRLRAALALLLAGSGSAACSSPSEAAPVTDAVVADSASGDSSLEDGAGDAGAETTSDSNEDAPAVEAGRTRTCEWRYMGTSHYKSCKPGEACALDVGTGIPDSSTTYKGLHCTGAPSGSTPNCGEIYCPVGGGWMCLDKAAGHCVSDIIP